MPGSPRPPPRTAARAAASGPHRSPRMRRRSPPHATRRSAPVARAGSTRATRRSDSSRDSLRAPPPPRGAASPRSNRTRPRATVGSRPRDPRPACRRPAPRARGAPTRRGAAPTARSPRSRGGHRRSAAAGGRRRPRRPLALDVLYGLREVRDPQVSPDGAWVAYTVASPDTAEDKNRSAVWMTSWDGARTVRLTTSKQGENTPRWSPDARYLGFLSSRDDEHAQLWLLNRSGGEGRKTTAFKGDVDDYVWAPDGKRIALVVEDADTAKPKTPAPIVIDRFQFKQDEIGYLGKRRRHLYVLDVESGQSALIPPGEYDELLPAWSPDGQRLVFVRKRRPHFDRDNNWGLYMIDAAHPPGAAPRQLTSFAGPDNDPDSESRPAWSPDGRPLAYLQGRPLQLLYYALQKLAVIPAAGGTPRILTAALDRNVSNPRWSADGPSS